MVFIGTKLDKNWENVKDSLALRGLWSKNIYHPENGQHPPPPSPPPSSSYIKLPHPTYPSLLCGQLYRQTGSAVLVYCRQSGKRLGEASRFKATGGAVRSKGDIGIFFGCYLFWPAVRPGGASGRQVSASPGPTLTGRWTGTEWTPPSTTCYPSPPPSSSPPPQTPREQSSM